MPKILIDIKNELINSAERILKEEGFGALSIRKLATECHVAAGTVYNYFENKDELVAVIMMKDWSRVLAEFNSIAEYSLDLTQGMREMYRALKDFIAKHADTWRQYAAAGGSGSVVVTHHLQLREQISKCIAKMGDNTGDEDIKKISPLLAETLLAAAMQNDINEEILCIMTDRITGGRK